MISHASACAPWFATVPFHPGLVFHVGEFARRLRTRTRRASPSVLSDDWSFPVDLMKRLAEMKAVRDKQQLVRDEMAAITAKGEQMTPGVKERFGNLSIAMAKLDSRYAELQLVPVDIDPESTESAFGGGTAGPAAGHKALGANPLSYDPRALDAIQDAIVTRAYKQVSADFKEGR